MIVVDCETFKYDWMVCYLDTETRTEHCITNDRKALEEFYEKYKYRIWVTYNGRGFDQWIIKGILAGFNPYKISDWIINQDRKGWEFSKLLFKFPMLIYDAMFGFRSLKELEAFMGDNIKESDVRFDIDRPLTEYELEQTKQYCMHDVWETFKVFVETKNEFESHIGLIDEFKLPMTYVNKTKAQLSAVILGASHKKRDDEFDISFPDTLELGRYEYIKNHFQHWSKNIQDYEQVTLETDIGGIPHVVSIGGLHGSLDNYIGDGEYVLADVSSYYPALMIEYDLLSRNVFDKDKFRQIRDERLSLKSNKDPREYPRKIVLNSSYGAMKDKYNGLYDPLMANNVCIYGQLFLIDLIDKLEDFVDIIQLT